MDQTRAEELVRRLATALRGTELHSPTHPLVQRGIDGLAAAATEALKAAPTVVIGFVGDEVIVDTTRLPRGTAALGGFARDLREREKRHVVDGAHILRRTPEMPALAPIVAFEHHLKQDLSGYPEKIRPQAKILSDKTGARLGAPLLVNTWERDGRGEHLRAVVEAVDPEPLAIDPLTYL